MKRALCFVLFVCFPLSLSAKSKNESDYPVKVEIIETLRTNVIIPSRNATVDCDRDYGAGVSCSVRQGGDTLYTTYIQVANIEGVAMRIKCLPSRMASAFAGAGQAMVAQSGAAQHIIEGCNFSPGIYHGKATKHGGLKLLYRDAKGKLRDVTMVKE